jgi:hypothetical protein
MGSGVLAAPIIGGLSMGAATGAGSLVGGFAVVAVILGSVALGVAPTVSAEADSGQTPIGIEQTDTSDDSTDGSDSDSLITDVVGDDTSGVVETVDGTVGGTVGGTVETVIDTITNGDGSIVVADISLHLTGTGTPGASVTAQAAGNVYANVVVDGSGHYVIDIAAFPGGLSSLQLVQTVDRNYLRAIVLGNNPLAETLGLLDGLINALVKPLGLSSGGGVVAIQLVG